MLVHGLEGGVPTSAAAMSAGGCWHLAPLLSRKGRTPCGEPGARHCDSGTPAAGRNSLRSVQQKMSNAHFIHYFLKTNKIDLLPPKIKTEVASVTKD